MLERWVDQYKRNQLEFIYVELIGMTKILNSIYQTLTKNREDFKELHKQKGNN